MAIQPELLSAQTAHFSAAESQVAYYTMGWDSQAEASTWSYSPTNSGNFTWHLEESTPYSDQPAFSSIDAASKYSLCVRYSSNSRQNEVAASPAIDILPGSTVEFYACFRSVFLVYAPWYFYIVDLDADSVVYRMNAFLWSQEHEFTGPSWQKFSVDLSAFAGMRASFAFQFTGPDGEDLAIDGFRLVRNTEEEGASITIAEGGQVHFLDQSEGSPASWQWTFEGGTPATSAERNPVVTYTRAGSYAVSLAVTGPDGTSSLTREHYINVVGQAPKALIGLPAEGYLSPWVARFVPAGVPVAYHDLSSGLPTQWHWTFEGGTPAESSEPDPVVTYNTPGLYGMTLDVENAVGSSHDFMVRAVQVGGSQYVWNIELDEYDDLGEVSLGWYGYYGGTNWLGMAKFAEHFDAPAEPVVIDSVQVFFYGTTAATAAAPITVELCLPGADGMPAEVLATASVPAGELAYDRNNIVPTDFVFAQRVTVDTDFFIVIGGFPNNEGDDISILCVRRDEGQKTTTWHLLEDEDPRTYEPLGTYTWFKNTDSPVSLCVTPRLTYSGTTLPVQAPVADNGGAAAGTEAVYSLSGQRVSGAGFGSIRIVRRADGSVRKEFRSRK